MNIDQTVTIITGASTGIGRATARLFARHGARVALVARSVAPLEQLAREIPAALAVPTDIRDPVAIQQMVRTIHEHYGRVDVLVNNAGQGMHGRVEPGKPR
jgi:NADP-dependent 3-hydroxy acid dehydrogenase YdfG